MFKQDISHWEPTDSSFITWKKGPPPEVNLFNEKNNGLTVLKLINESLIESCHDISLGGIIVAISKMCIKSKKGIKLSWPKCHTDSTENYD